MKRFTLITALILGTTAPALANDQLARSLGVEPGVYTLNELAQLKSAMESDDQPRVRAILNGGEVISTQNIGITPGHARLAASIGVDPQSYGLTQIAAIKSAMDDDDAFRVRALMNGGEVISTQSVGISAGHAQLARQLGVDPEDYSLNQLAQMKMGRYDDD